jgi:hypothetical protein
VEVIIICLLIGECFFSGAMAIRFFAQKQILQRIYYLMICSIGLVLPYLTKIAFSESLVTYLLSFAIAGLIFLLFSYKKLDLPKSPMA